MRDYAEPEEPQMFVYCKHCGNRIEPFLMTCGPDGFTATPTTENAQNE